MPPNAVQVVSWRISGVADTSKDRTESGLLQLRRNSRRFKRNLHSSSCPRRVSYPLPPRHPRHDDAVDDLEDEVDVVGDEDAGVRGVPGTPISLATEAEWRHRDSRIPD